MDGEKTFKQYTLPEYLDSVIGLSASEGGGNSTPNGTDFVSAPNVLATSKAIVVGDSNNRTEIDPNKGIRTSALRVQADNQDVLMIDSAGNLVARNATLSGTLNLDGLLKIKSYLVADLPAISADVGASEAFSGSVAAWSNPGNAKTYTGLLATVNDNSGAPVVSEYLKITDFDYAIPEDAVILGIGVEIDKLKRASTSTYDHSVKLVKKDGTYTTVNKADTVTAWVANAGNGRIFSYGGMGELWGENWTPADINSVNFGAVFAVTTTNSAGATSGAGVALVRVVVYYTANLSPVGQGSMAFALNGLKDGETANNGSGVLVIHDGRLWRNPATGATVAS